MAKKTCLLLGATGLLAGGVILFVANLLHRYIPVLVPPLPFLSGLFFLFFLAVALLEIPLMLVVLRRMKRASLQHPSKAYCGLSIFFVAFPAIYASFYLLLIGWLVGSLAIAATSLLRFGLLLFEGREVAV
ncbi:MAG: hypothetical protein GXP41_02120 [Chloroflexi bacterium]|nr:hypothetical protein [Chloroflexota bacterium]